MSRLFYHVMQDNVGNLLFGVTGTMRLAGSGTLATIYGDEALTVILGNPLTNHPSFGSFKCYLGPGAYDFYMAKAGYTFETLTGLQGSGTLAQQDASAVAITGGTATLSAVAVTGQSTLNRMVVPDQSGSSLSAINGLMEEAGGTNRWNLFISGDAPNWLQGRLGIGVAPVSNAKVEVYWNKAAQYGMRFRPFGTDTSLYATITFDNSAGVSVGYIVSDGTSTSYATTSDVRLKHAALALTGALDVVAALRPKKFRWNVDESPGVGFLAHELQQVLPEAVTGQPDAVDAQGNILPQGVDHSKLVPWLTAALQEAVAQVAALQARVTALEAALRL